MRVDDARPKSCPPWCVADHAGEVVPDQHGEFFLRHYSVAARCLSIDQGEAVEARIGLASLTTNDPSEDEPPRVRLVVPTSPWEEAHFDRDQALRLAEHITAEALKL